MATPRKTDRAPRVRLKLTQADVHRAVAKGAAAIDSAQLLNALIECWGGPQRFARDIFQEYQVAKAGSLTRQRILEMATRLTVQVTSQEIAKPRSVTEMSNDELVATAKTLLEKINGPAAGPAETA